MRVFNTLGLTLTIIIGFVAFYATSNVFIGGGVLIAGIIFYFLVIYKILQKYILKINRIHECYLFINNFLITLSIKESLNAAFEATTNSISEDFSEYVLSIGELNPQEKLLYLSKYFTFHIYRIFADIVLLWQEEGGKILDMSSHITNEMREIEEYTTYSKSISKRKSIEIGTLWLFSLAIVVVLRLSLSDIFAGLLSNPIYLIAVPGLMLVFLLSMFLLVKRVTKLEIRGSEDVK